MRGLTLPDWESYPKHYMGVSHIPDVANGIRFDVSVVPGFHRKESCLPPVLRKPVYHLWKEANPDFIYYPQTHILSNRT